MCADLEHHPPIDPGLHAKLHRWVAASLVTDAEADAIEAFEAGEARAASRRVPLVTEALAYLGAALALGAGAAVLADRWADMHAITRASAVGIAALGLLLAGWLLRGSEEPAIARLTSVLWLLASGLVVWFSWVLALDVFETPTDRMAGLVGGAVGLAVSASLYAYRRSTLQHVAVAVTLASTTAFAFYDPAWNGVAWCVIGVAWFGLGVARVLVPRRTALAIGSIGALVSALVLATDQHAAGLLLGSVVAVALVAASVRLRETPILAIGVVGMFLFLVQTVAYFFQDTLGAPIALLAAGAIVLVVALVLARRSRPTRSGPRSPS